MTETISIDNISKNLVLLFADQLKSILDNISQEYNIDSNILYAKYINNAILKTNLTVNKKKKKQKVTKGKILCMARKQDGNQCTRRPKPSSEYCGKHIKNRKYGRVDNNHTQIVDKLIDDDNYIMTWIEEFNGKSYLVDTNNVVYTNNVSSPSIIGKKIGEGKLELLTQEQCISSF